jgi:hypothetical protein
MINLLIIHSPATTEPSMPCLHVWNRGNQRCTPSQPTPQGVVPPKQVNTAINCELVNANESTEGLLSKATITEDLTFTLVSSQGNGASLAFGIPVFSAVTIGPSISDLNKLTNTSQITNSFSIPDLNALKPSCPKNKSRVGTH